MVVKFDQTGTKMVPVSDWTLEEQVFKQIEMIGLKDNEKNYCSFCNFTDWRTSSTSDYLVLCRKGLGVTQTCV